MSPGVGHSLRASACALFLLAVACGSFWLCTRHNDFSVKYHPDERGKARQIAMQEWNFKHPQMLLVAIRAATLATGPTPEQLAPFRGPDGKPSRSGIHNEILRVARPVSAVFAALTVVAFAGAAWLFRGATAGVLVGLLLMFSHGLIVRGHYVKEDTALVFGLAVATLGMVLLDRWKGDASRAWRALVITALGCGLSSSGKYVGVGILVPALALVAVNPALRAQRRRAIGVVLAITLALFSAVNFEAFRHWGSLVEGIVFEWTHVTTDHRGLVNDRWGYFGARTLWYESTLPVLFGALAWCGWVASTWRRRTALERTLLLIPIGTFFVLTRSAMQSDRHFLPVVTWLHFLGGLGVAAAATWLWRRRGVGVVAAVAVAALAAVFAGRTGVIAAFQFGQDIRYHGGRIVAQKLSEGDVVLVNPYCKSGNEIRAAGYETQSFHTRTRKFTLERMRRKGATHALVCNLEYDRYVNDHRWAKPESRERFVTNRNTYREIFERGELVWESKPPFPLPYYVNPTMRLYRLPQPLHAAARD